MRLAIYSVMNMVLSIQPAVAEAPNPQGSDSQPYSSEQAEGFSILLSQLMQAVMSLPAAAEFQGNGPAVQAQSVMISNPQAEGASQEMASLPLLSSLQTVMPAMAKMTDDLPADKGTTAQAALLADSVIGQPEALLSEALFSSGSLQTEAAANKGIALSPQVGPAGNETLTAGQKSGEPVQLPADMLRRKTAAQPQLPQEMRHVMLSEGRRNNAAALPEGEQRVENYVSPETLPVDSPGAHGVIRMHAATGNDSAALARPQQFSEAMHGEDNRFMVTRMDRRSIEISLQPEGLGKLDIRLVLDKGVVNTQIQASHAAGKEMVERNITEIVNALAREGITIGGFSVSLRDGSNDYKKEEQRQHSDQQQIGAVRIGEVVSNAPRRFDQGMVSIFI